MTGYLSVLHTKQLIFVECMITAVSTTALHAGRESCGLPCVKQVLGSGFSPETASVCVCACVWEAGEEYSCGWKTHVVT